MMFDVDGTLALRVSRAPFEWDKVSQDSPNQPVIEVMKALRMQGYQIIYVSGRPEKTRIDTEAWLLKHCGADGKLFMRPDGDNRKDSIVKREIFEIAIAPNYEVLSVFDDRSQVVEMWRHELGLTCFQVADGNF